MRVGCVVAQRNEDDCLEPWMRYYSYLFGLENVFVIDNGSDSEVVKNLLERYEALGTTVKRIPPGTDLQERGNYTSEFIKSITSKIHYDFFFPLDCDEFLYVVNTRGEYSCNRHDIENHLSSFLGTPDVLHVYKALENLHKKPGLYRCRPIQKVFFSGDSCDGLDIGFHRGESRLSAQQIETKIGYLHFHWRPYGTYTRMARQKLADFVDVNDREALANYPHGYPNFHLTKLLLMNEEQYDEHLAAFGATEEEAISFPQFSNVLKMLGIRPEFIDGQGTILPEAALLRTTA